MYLPFPFPPHPRRFCPHSRCRLEQVKHQDPSSRTQESQQQGAKGGKTIGSGKSTKARTRQEAKEGGKRKSVGTRSLYIYQLYKQVHTDTGNSNKAMNNVNKFINDVFDRL